MDANSLGNLITPVIGVSVASERLVEIVKGISPWLNTSKAGDADREGLRCAALQALAVGAGVLTAYLGREYLTVSHESWFVVGLLASGGSSFWNSILTYVGKIKDLKEAEADTAKAAARTATTKAAGN